LLKEGEILTATLRIYALIRLGISDVETIASILDYTVNTVYTYKARIKAKASVPPEEFEQKIMSIKFTDGR
jgi:DNA-binding CsgD family transcriptional regulator